MHISFLVSLKDEKNNMEVGMVRQAQGESTVEQVKNQLFEEKRKSTVQNINEGATVEGTSMAVRKNIIVHALVQIVQGKGSH